MVGSVGLKSSSRVRWAAIGAAVAVAVGAGGLLTASAAVSPAATSFVPITPCRLMDTRAATSVGPRATPITGGETYSALVWGTNGHCTIPATATAVSMNVTFVNPSQPGFVTVYPPDKPWPGTSNLNFVAAQAPAPNAVTSPLSADGKIGFFNSLGTVDLVADIVGYYEPAGPGPGGQTIASGVTVTGLAGIDTTSSGPGDEAFPVTLPAKAPVALSDGGLINFAGTAAATSDDDPLCTGTAAVPTAPPGRVCLYLYGSNGADSINGSASANLSDQGFWVYWNSTLAAGMDMYVWVTWAYTAP